MPIDRCTIANESTIGKSGQKKLAGSCIGIAGLGGVGGIAFELLVRAGVGRIKIADGGFFEESNANRQSLWTRGNDGRKKTQVAQEFAKEVNPNVRIFAFGDITAANTLSFASGCTAVIDATDRKHSRLAVYSGCEKSKIPYIFASALGERGMLTVVSGKQFGQHALFSNKPASKFIACDHSLGPVSNAIGCLAAQQALNVILGKQTVSFPEILSLDAFSANQAAVHVF